MLKFTTGNFNFAGYLNFTDNVVSNDNMFLVMTLNGATVISLVYRSGAAGSDNLNPYDIFIPSYTEDEIKEFNSGEDPCIFVVRIKNTSFMTPRKYILRGILPQPQ